MKRTVVVLGLLVGTVNANAQESVLYCVTDEAVGFNGDGTVFKGSFEGKKLTIKLDGQKAVLKNDNATVDLTCGSYMDDENGSLCHSDGATYFTFNRENMRFVLSTNSGYVLKPDKALVMAIGTCSTF